MASRTLETNNTDADDPNDVEPTKLGEDETMEAAGSNRMKNDEEMLEFNVKWQLPGHHDAMTAKKIVQELLATLLVYQPNDVTFIDTKKREWEFNEKVDEDAFMQESNQMALSVHPIKNKQKQVVRWVTITRIRSMSTIQDWKDNDHFYSAADAASAYIFPHPFPVEAWDTITIGFIKNIHAVHYPKELLHDQLYDMLTAQTQTPPPFQVIPQRITSPDKVATTKAYTIHCQKDDAAQLLHLFTHGPFRMEPNQIFVPFRYKNKNPDLFTKCIRQQNEVYHKTWIIKLEGLTTEMMRTILPELSKVNGVMHVVPSRRLHEIGEWKMLVDQTKCSYIHRQLSQVWTTIINHIPSELMKAAPPSFSVPTISSKRAREYQDTDSDEDSYGSLLSTGTTVSVMTTDDASLNEMPEEYRHPSYAAAAASSMKSGTDTQVSSPTTSTYTDWKLEKQQLEQQVRDQAAQIEKIQADLQTKIIKSKDLEDQSLAQAIELAHTRDARLEEMLQKFEQLMKLHVRDSVVQPDNVDDKADDQGQDISQPTTPDRLQHASPPTKKPNQNASPHRNIYSIFRQQQSRQSSPKSRKQSSGATTQPMETDDTNRQPLLGAKPSNRKQG